MDDHVDLAVAAGETLLEAESVSYGWCDCNEDAFHTAAWISFDIAGTRTMRTGEVVCPQAKVVQKCMLSTEFGVQRDAMCAQIIAEVIKVDVAAICEVLHLSRSIAR